MLPEPMGHITPLAQASKKRMRSPCVASAFFVRRRVWQVINYDCIALIAMWLIWAPGEMAVTRGWLATGLAASVYAGFLAKCIHLHLTRSRSKRRLITTLRQIQVNRRIERTLFNRSAGSGVYLEGTSPQLPQRSMTGTSHRFATGPARRSYQGFVGLTKSLRSCSEALVQSSTNRIKQISGNTVCLLP